MPRYILRRLLYMIPTLAGVLLITFVLFNVVGGSPAQMALGKNASPQALEEFDEQRGFNKPVIAGRWAGTRACPAADFRAGAGAWRAVAGVRHETAGPGSAGRLVVPAGADCALPLAFPLRPDTACRLVLTYRLPAGAQAAWSAGPESPLLAPVRPSARWRRAAVVFGPSPSPVAPRLAVRGGDLELRSLTLQRRNRHLLDSQLGFYLRQLARLDFGVSIATNQRVSRMLRAGLLPSLALTVPIFTAGLALSLSLALLCAYVRDSWLDRLLVFVAVLLMSVNYLVWIVAGQFVLAFKLGWFPVWGFESWRYLLLPVAIGTLSGLGSNLRFYRTVMLEEMHKDYVRTARAKGRGAAGVLFAHVLPNAMIPVVTNTVIAIPFLYTGSLLLESFFGIPGLGGISVNAINSADVDVVRGVVLVGAVLYMGANLLSDVAYALVDPRVRLQ
jgi:peptide/nickel transport system permease protein